MTVLGMPLSMFLVFAATVLAGSLGAIHYTVVHIILGRPFEDEGERRQVRDPGGRTAGGPRADRKAPDGGAADV
jgi:hypothetical protein